MESRSEIVQTKVSFSQQIRKVKEEMELAKGSLTEALNEVEKKWYSCLVFYTFNFKVRYDRDWDQIPAVQNAGISPGPGINVIG